MDRRHDVEITLGRRKLVMARTKRWNWSAAESGCVEVKLSSWKYFGDFVYQEMLDYTQYIWRGQRCDNWKLESTLDRLIRNAKVPLTKSSSFRDSHLEQFKYAARGRRGTNPPALEDEDSWWALGQHHGLATPLLDWTTSPFVAAFFAFIEVDKPQTSHRAVYALHKPTIEKLARLKMREENARRREALTEAEKSGKKLGLFERARLESKATVEVSFIRPLSDENQRLVNQGGLFSKVSAPKKTIDEWTREHHDPDDKGNVLIKLLIPDRDRDGCLRYLNRMNINHLSLFPDLTGASRFCNLHSEVDKY